jgi:hypothetical protein
VDPPTARIARGGEVGFCYGRFANNLPSPQDVASFLVQKSISKVRIFDNDQTVIQAFANTNIELVKPLLDFLRSVGSFMMINAYPYLAYTNDPTTVPLDYALFQGQQAVVDPNTTLQYTSLYDAQLDALYFAMEGMGHS